MVHRLPFGALLVTALLISPVLPLVAGAEPRVDSVSPSRLVRGKRTMLVILGDDLDAGTDVLIPDWRIEVLSFSATADEIDVLVQVGQRALAGSRDLTLTFADADPLVLADAFLVVPGPAVLLAVNPDDLIRGSTEPVQVQGLNLDDVLELQCTTGIQVLDYQPVSTDPTRATATLTIGDLAALGGHDLTAVTPSGPIDPLVDAIRVWPGDIQVNSLAPSTVVRGAGVTIEASGLNLDGVASIEAGHGIRFESLSALDPTHLTASALVSQDALPVSSPRDVVFFSADATVTLPQALSILPSTLELTSVRPGTAAQGASAVLTLDGLNLDGLSDFEAGPGVSVDQVQALSPIRAVVDIAVAVDAVPGYRDVTVEGSFGEDTLAEALLIRPREVTAPRINYPDLVDFGLVEVQALKRVSLILFNESDASHQVGLQIASGDVRDFCFHDPSGESLATLEPDRLTISLDPMGEQVVVAEFRPSLQVSSEVTVDVTANGQRLGGITLSGRGLAPVLGFYPPAPLSFPTVAEGETALAQVSTLSESSEPTRLEDIELWVERGGSLFPMADDLTVVLLSEPIPPQIETLFGATMITIETEYPAGSYRGELHLYTDRATAPIMPLTFYADVVSEEPLDPGDDPPDEGEDRTDAAGDLPIEVADLPPEVTGDLRDDPVLDHGGPADPDVETDLDSVPQSGCCSHLASHPFAVRTPALLLVPFVLWRRRRKR